MRYGEYEVLPIDFKGLLVDCFDSLVYWGQHGVLTQDIYHFLREGIQLQDHLVDKFVLL